jgi:co-chaperonin GroES (HSP10)
MAGEILLVAQCDKGLELSGIWIVLPDTASVAPRHGRILAVRRSSVMPGTDLKCRRVVLEGRRVVFDAQGILFRLREIAE